MIALEPGISKETQELLTAYFGIADTSIRRRLRELVSALAASGQTQEASDEAEQAILQEEASTDRVVLLSPPRQKGNRDWTPCIQDFH